MKETMNITGCSVSSSIYKFEKIKDICRLVHLKIKAISLLETTVRSSSRPCGDSNAVAAVVAAAAKTQKSTITDR